MIHPTNSDKTQLDALISHGMSDRQTNNNLAESYKEQRQSFLLKRLQLQAQIMLIAGLTLIVFFLWANSQLEGKIYAFKIGIVVEVFTLICWVLCKTPIGRRHPDLIFLSLCWSVTCVVQIDIALLFNNLEPRSNIWTLMFLTQATIIPVQWWMHLISQLGTIICYLSLYILYNPILKNPSAFYVEQGLYFFWTCIICVFSVYLYERLRKKEFYARKAMELAQQKSERLLLNILPEMIAEQLKQQPTTIADSFLEVTVLFADIVGFTELSTRTSPAELVELLNTIFCLFDQLAERHGVEKIKTIGDAYMAVSGLQNQSNNHAPAIANMALDMQNAIAKFNAENNQLFRIRIGISTGPVVAGVIGLKKFAYDLWGDTVNTASRMESHGIAGSIQVCEATYQLLKDKYLLEKRGFIQVKGKGEMMTYILKEINFKN
ncbi:MULTISPECIES: adenylate/guanylate cyclase domain-containing protein [unclassified Nostoc]|uniref:adenylate/guanylate cyclase domain-containing protein n=1 Tax=unclassified Nostoc TaxID=2593658 RepID=UPI002AD2FE01|nr:adenylate/guanylate cyclase domain-containing protein [Nostoc sp. DedQUE03]MDZ7971086.1 adenylate/guanylate cyclase domain-containing protein [Nostoc sp. DedQUE03]MDZ8048514.1 adenylate/guanylate cyclase domain-containing protein [Nostoc sp. DedQUE02]